MTASTATATTSVTAKDAFLRFTMRLDAVLSGLVGVASVALAPRIAEWCGTTPSFEYSVGAVFIVYAAAVYGLSTGRNLRGPGVVVISANVVFTVAAVGAVLADVWPLTTAGVVAFIGSGVYTLVMADLQYLGLRRLRG